MINEAVVKQLKQTNISKDPEKTKARVYELWKASTKAQKSLVEEMAGISRATIYRVYNTGSISAKLVTPMAQTFDVDPDYLTAKTDSKGECNEEILINFLNDLGYDDVIKTEMKKAKRRKPRKIAPVAAVKRAAKEKVADLVPVAKAPAFVSENLTAENLTAEDLQLLMQSLLLKEKAGSADAAAKVAELRALLLS